MKQPIKVAFAAGSEPVNRELIERVAGAYPEWPLYVVAEFPPHRGEWIPYHPQRSFNENMTAVRAAVASREVWVSAVLSTPRMHHGRMRLMALLISTRRFLAYNEEFEAFMLRPRSVVGIARHLLRRGREAARWYAGPQSFTGRWVRRLAHPRGAEIPLLARLAQLSGKLAQRRAVLLPALAGPSGLQPGVTAVIPSRNGRSLLAEMLPAVVASSPDEIIVVDNGSSDGTADWIRATYPTIQVEISDTPLSFSRAVNSGISRARFSHVLLLNNDMLLRRDFLPPLLRAFQSVPDLFCATAQIFFPEGRRREETGKAVMRPGYSQDFPVRCDPPIRGEDQTYVLYGSGGCSLFDTVKLRELGGFHTLYSPAYVEDLDVGYRGWLRGWPTVFVSQAQVEHRHRSTTARYYTEEQLSSMVEVNYLRFLASAVRSPELFQTLWDQAVRRLHLSGHLQPLKHAWKMPWRIRVTGQGEAREEDVLALTNGDVAVFPGRARSGKPLVLVATPYAPFPLAHGGAVRIFNLMTGAAADFDQVMIAFCENLDTPPPALLDLCVELILVKRTGTHLRKQTDRPDVVEEFDSPTFRAALQQTMRKWRPPVVQLEFTQMAQYAAECRPARTILVEHDITFDLLQQLLANTALEGAERWEAEQQLERWRTFETAAWQQVDSVVTMSEKDRLMSGPKAVCLPNGVDLRRYQPSTTEPQPNTILFIGSFAHLPNILAVEFLLREVMPLLRHLSPKLHVIAGARHEYYLDYYQKELDLRGVHTEGFVSDVRPAYRNAAVVVAPLLASAGTNIKVLEAMAMGKALVSTTAGINGLDLRAGTDLLLADGAASFADAVSTLLQNADRRRELERQARCTAVEHHGWEQAAQRQRDLYHRLIQ